MESIAHIQAMTVLAVGQPELLPVLRVQMFLVAGLLDAVAMIGIGFALFFTFANPFLSAVQAAH